MAKKENLKNESSLKKSSKKETATKKETVEAKETPAEIIVLRALNNKYPRWINGLALEADLLEAIHPVHLRDVLDKLVSEKTVAYDLGNFSYQITDAGKNLLDNV